MQRDTMAVRRPLAPRRAAAVRASAGGRGGLFAVLVLFGCSGATRSNAPPAEAPVRAGDGVAQPALLVADVDAVWHAHVLAPAESLAVRLLGTVGPNGNWSLERIAVESTTTGVRIVPRVKQGNAPQVIQMVIPLDVLLWVRLPPGTHTVEVQGRDSTFVDRVRVAPGMTRRPPDTHLAYQIVTNVVRSQDYVTIQAMPGDGFVEAIEVRETRASGVGAWRRLEGCQRVSAGLDGRVLVPENGDLLTLEARAVDGQGERDPEPGLLNLPSH